MLSEKNWYSFTIKIFLRHLNFVSLNKFEIHRLQALLFINCIESLWMNWISIGQFEFHWLLWVFICIFAVNPFVMLPNPFHIQFVFVRRSDWSMDFHTKYRKQPETFYILVFFFSFLYVHFFLMKICIKIDGRKTQ